MSQPIMTAPVSVDGHRWQVEVLDHDLVLFRDGERWSTGRVIDTGSDYFINWNTEVLSESVEIAIHREIFGAIALTLPSKERPS